MNKTTQKKLAKQLAKYSALTLAVGGITESNGQIIYTDVTPDYAGGNGTNYGLDMDNDTTIDFGIIGSTTPAVGIYGLTSMNSFLGSQPGPYIYPFALNSGDPISSGQATWFGSYDVGTLNYNSCYGGIGSSNWCGVTDKYLGLRFQIGANTHYGWARLDVSASGDSFTVKDYAYNSVPDAPIDAGQTLDVDEFSRNNVRIVALNKTIGLYNLPSSTDYSLFSISGQKVAQGSIANQDSYTIEAYGVSSGVYIIELVDSDTKDVLRKKIVL